MEPLATHFHEVLLTAYHTAKRECGYNATYFIRMLNELGGVETAHRLLSSTNPAAGLTALWECGRLDLSLEAHVLRPEFAALFAEEERVVARARLIEYGYTQKSTVHR